MESVVGDPPASTHEIEPAPLPNTPVATSLVELFTSLASNPAVLQQLTSLLQNAAHADMEIDEGGGSAPPQAPLVPAPHEAAPEAPAAPPVPQAPAPPVAAAPVPQAPAPAQPVVPVPQAPAPPVPAAPVVPVPVQPPSAIVAPFSADDIQALLSNPALATEVRKVLAQSRAPAGPSYSAVLADPLPPGPTANTSEIQPAAPAAPEVIPSATSFNTPLYKLPSPPKFNGKLSADIVDLDVWAEDVKLFSQSMRVKIQPALCLLTTGNARTHIDNMQRTAKLKQIQNPAKIMTDEKFLAKFIAHFKGQTKPRNVSARDKLFSGEIYQRANQSVTEYEGLFNQIVLDAQPMEDIDVMFWFRKGLQPEIREGCIKPTTGKRDFSSLKELVTQALLHEDVLRESNKTHKVPKLAAAFQPRVPNPRPSSYHQQAQNNRKRSATDDEGWQTVQNRRPRHGYQGKGAGYQGKKYASNQFRDFGTKSDTGIPFSVWSDDDDKKYEAIRKARYPAEPGQPSLCARCGRQGHGFKTCNQPADPSEDYARWLVAREAAQRQYNQSRKGRR